MAAAQPPSGEAPPRPKMTLNGEVEAPPEFLGVVIADNWEFGQYGWQWHLSVKPVDITLQGQTGAFHTWYRQTTKKNSAMGAARTAMQNLFAGDLDIGESKLVGQVAWWIRKDLNFGKNQQTGEEMIAENVLIPVRVATEEEKQRAALRGGTAPTPATTPAPEAAELPAGDQDAILKLIDGKNKGEIQKAAVSTQGLAREVKQGLISGKLLQALCDQGLAFLDGDTYRAVA